ncbi:MAG: DNA-protecting protein DprA [Treponema sp.]|nr:DNA-protecting protein DprA [Treponema sp.]
MHYTQNNSDENLIFNISLARISFLSCKEKNILSKKLDSSRSLALLSIEEIFKFLDRPASSRAEWNGQANFLAAQRIADICYKRGFKLLGMENPEYPELLRNIEDPPFLLYCRGDTSVLKEPCVSLVGTRRLTPLGRKAAHDFAYDAVKAGLGVVSGLAYGADAYAHKGAVDAFYDIYPEKGINKLGKTVAVLPSGIDQILPSGNKTLAEKILKSGGCIISEYEPGLPMAPWHYVARNRIIAGLSPAVVVIEAPVGSGALITADFALEDGRDVFFHQAALSMAAQEVSADVKRDLELRFARKEVSKYKIENSVRKYLEAGAVVIKDYKDYCRALVEAPGERQPPLLQGELF